MGDKIIAAGDKRIAAGNKRIAAGDKRIAAGDKRIAAGDKRVATGDKRVATGDKRVAARQKDSRGLFLQFFFCRTTFSPFRKSFERFTNFSANQNGTDLLITILNYFN
ncbi:hypothetical protein XENTR_v10012818 [Xenopus tropicalis]|nr:hypothetical protein XENTR_v10012818 [Xenopus tropicalis]